MNKTIIWVIGVAIALIAGFYAGKAIAPSLVGGGSATSFYANATATTTTTSIGKASTVLKKNTARKYAICTNISATIAYLGLYSTSTSGAWYSPVINDAYFAIPLAASGGSYVFNSENLYTGAVVASSSAAVTIRCLDNN